jgi:ribosomal protein S18 acetylase RimI-like enzyme
MLIAGRAVEMTPSLNVTIEPLAATETDALAAYLSDQLRDNGQAETGYFQPVPAGSGLPAAKIEAFRTALCIPIPEPGWRRAWVARSAGREIVGHVDLRARPEPFAQHRCLLGMGVHRDWRRLGIGRLLVEHAGRWAEDQEFLDWIDLEVISTNEPAARLYRRLGFAEVGEVFDLFRIDGAELSCKSMVKRLAGRRAG